jgi:hypothetical protein
LVIWLLSMSNQLICFDIFVHFVFFVDSIF